MDGMRCPTTECRAPLVYADVQTWAVGGDEAGIGPLFEKWVWSAISATTYTNHIR